VGRADTKISAFSVTASNLSKVDLGLGIHLFVKVPEAARLLVLRCCSTPNHFPKIKKIRNGISEIQRI